MGGWFVDIYVEYLFRVVMRAVRLVRSRDWPVMRATVLSAECPHAGYGCTVAIIYYEYILGGQTRCEYFESKPPPFA